MFHCLIILVIILGLPLIVQRIRHLGLHEVNCELRDVLNVDIVLIAYVFQLVHQLLIVKQTDHPLSDFSIKLCRRYLPNQVLDLMREELVEDTCEVVLR